MLNSAKRGLKIFGLVLVVMSAGAGVHAEPFRLESSERKTTLLEVFSSEGCSSCPPAESWVSRLTRADSLWREMVPVVFHVHYWDDLGWKDSFSSPAFSKRQSQYVHSWGQSTLYTPGVVLNGRPWEGWHRARAIPLENEKPGVLTIEAQANDDYKVSFKPAASFSGGQAHMALLGFGIDIHVTRGENAGKVLRHDFTVLEFQSKPLTGALPSAVFHFSTNEFSAGRFGAAAWVTAAGDVKPVQAVGGYIPAKK